MTHARYCVRVELETSHRFNSSDKVQPPGGSMTLLVLASQLPMNTLGRRFDRMQRSLPSGVPSASENQPMSVSNAVVRSYGGSTELVRSLLIAGSIS